MFSIFLKIIKISVYKMIEMCISTCMSVFAFTLNIDAMPLCVFTFTLSIDAMPFCVFAFTLNIDAMPLYECFRLHPQHRCDIIVCFSVVASRPKTEWAQIKHESIISLHYTYVINHILKLEVCFSSHFQ
jgi:hypothetical protein